MKQRLEKNANQLDARASADDGPSLDSQRRGFTAGKLGSCAGTLAVYVTKA